MFKKSNLFPLFVLFVLACIGVRAQETTITRTVPGTPEKGAFQVFTNDGGSYMGIQLQEVNKENFSKFGLRDVRGAAIAKVTENSPAAQAGLQNGDVIVRFEGEEVSSVRKLQRLIGEVAPDHQAKVTVLRDGKEREVTVTMGKRPNTPFAFTTGTATLAIPSVQGFPVGKIPTITARPTMPVMPRMGTALKTLPNGDNMVWSFAFGRTIGIGTSSLTKQLGDYFGVADGKGILVTSVRENSPAAKAGLKAGDIIIEADNKAVSDSMELMKAINSKEKGTVTLTFIRDKNRQTVTVEPEENKDGNKMFEFKTATPVPTVKGAISVTPEVAPFVMTTSIREM